MKAHTKHLLVDQKVEQSPASVVVELTDAELEVIVGGGISCPTHECGVNHNETMVIATEMVF